MARKPEYTVEQVENAIRAGGGIQAAAAVVLGCSRQTVGGYLKRHPELVEVQKDVRESLVDLAEGVVLKAVKKDNLVASFFVLKTFGKNRGWSERFELTGSEGKALPPLQVIINDPTKPPPEAG